MSTGLVTHLTDLYVLRGYSLIEIIVLDKARLVFAQCSRRNIESFVLVCSE